MNKFFKPLWAVLFFVLMQGVIGSIGLTLIVSAVSPEFRQVAQDVAEGKGSQQDLLAAIPAEWMALTIMVSGLLTVLFCWKVLKSIPMRRTLNCSSMDWSSCFIGILAAVLGIFSFDLLNEQLDLPNWMEQNMLSMSTSILGMIAIAVVGPIVEELVFREAILGQLIRSRVHPWVAIGISSLFFGIIHFNPAQVPFAFMMGIILGLLYYKTGNIILPSIVHILNNGLVVIVLSIYGQEANDFSYTKALGGTQNAWAVIVVSLIFCSILLQLFMNRYTPSGPTALNENLTEA